MSPAQLLAHFDRVSEAPGAVPRLRRFILDLAVRGKLVEQDPNDEPACELLKRIQEEKTRLFKSGEILRQKPLTPVELDAIPFDIPRGWEWARIRHVTCDRGQRVPDTEFTYIDVTSIDKDLGRIADPRVLQAADAPSRARKVVRRGDVLYSCVRPYLLNIAVVDREIDPPPIASTAFAVLNGFGLIVSKYLWIVLRSPFMVACVESRMRGQAYPAINDADFALLPLPLPPVAEQHRIVACVEVVMALCDRLDAAQAERERRRDRLAVASLNRLNEPTNQSESREHVRFHLNHLPQLTTRREHIKELRRTFFNLAVGGRLVQNDPNDEPASELLRRIQKEKARLAEEGCLRREKPLPPPTDVPFAVPVGWKWGRIGTCCLLTDYGTSVKSHESQAGVPVLKMGDLQGGLVVLGSHKKVPQDIEDLPKLFLRRLDLLYNRTNSAELVGKTGIYLGPPDAYTFASYLIRIRLVNHLMNARYINLAMNAPYFRRTQIVPELQQQCGQANVNGTKLRLMLVPIPPLSEQHRIVAKMDELMAVCDQLETQLAVAETQSSRLLEAILNQALAVA